MNFSSLPRLALVLIGLSIGTAQADAQTIETLGTGFNYPASMAVDGSGNVFVADPSDGTVKEILASGGYTTIKTLLTGIVQLGENIAADSNGNIFLSQIGTSTLNEYLVADAYATPHPVGSGFSGPAEVTIDRSGNLFLIDSNGGYFNSIKEVLAAGGYVTVKTLVSNAFNSPSSIAVDSKGNVFIGELNGDAVYEIFAVNGSVPAQPTIKQIASGFGSPGGVGGIAVDASGNLFVADPLAYSIFEIPAAGNDTTINIFGSGFLAPYGVAGDGNGNVFIGDAGNGTVKKVFSGAPVLLASVLPGSRAVEIGTPATILATMINTGPTPLDNCQIALPPQIAYSAGTVTLDYQTTDPATNVPIGQPNTPVSIPGGNGVQSFVLSIQGTAANYLPATPVEFQCGGNGLIQAAATVPSVDTVDLDISSTPIADIIALAATPTNNGIVEIPENGAAAFAIASINIGATGPITVSTDTGSAKLPLTTAICQTDPGSGQCLAPPAASVSLTFGAGSAPTFSVFMQSSGAIAFAPASSRILVRFEDPNRDQLASTSVAVRTP